MAVKVKQPARPPVAIKGTRDGLLFLIDEQCAFQLLLEHLEQVLEGEGSILFTETEVAVSIDFGARTLSNAEHRALLNAFLKRENFVIREWGGKTQSRSATHNAGHSPKQTVIKGTVRNGQQLQFEGDLVLIGDVNPGGEVIAGGDIFVFGRLRGVAHAGAAGQTTAVIAAAEFAPLQLRIADVVSRAPDPEFGKSLATFMEFAYLKDGMMAVDKMTYRASLMDS